MERVISWFSCGAASACATKLAINKYGDRVVPVYCDMLLSEHPDNTRFLEDVENWIGISITKIHSELYSSVDDVFEKTRYMAGIGGARCTTELKKIPRRAFENPEDLHIFGYTNEEQKRISIFEGNNPEVLTEWILRDSNMSKKNCLDMVQEAGIKLPVMYGLGFTNNNCIGCVKATSPKYWNLVRKHFPDIFERRAKQSRDINCKLTRIGGGGKWARIFLDELESDSQLEFEEDLSCGAYCYAEPA